MYESYFELNRAPFSAMPDPACFVRLAGMQNAFEQSLSCLRSGQGLAILTGAAGTGKSLLCRKLLNEVGDAFAGVYLPNSNFPTRRALLQAILYELGQPYIRLSAQELRLELKTALQTIRPQSDAILLIVDEAHLLNDRLLEEIRTMTTLVPADQPLVRVLLSGQLPLEEKLIQPSLEALNQQVRCQVALERLTLRESAEYIASRLAWAGGDALRLFTDEALRAVCHASDGLPRCLNQLCDHSLQLVCSCGRQIVDLQIVRQALDDLRQLPLQWNDLSGVFGTEESETETVRDGDSIAGSAVDETSATNSFTLGDDELAEEQCDSLKSTVEVIEVGADDDEPSPNRSIPEPETEITAPIGVVSIDEFTVTDEHLVGFQADAASLGDRGESVVIGPPAELQHGDAEPSEQAISEAPAADAICTGELLGATAIVQDPGNTETSHATRGVSARVDDSNAATKFAEEPVLDRYAFLDAGRSLPHELLAGRSGETQAASDDPFLKLRRESEYQREQTTSTGRSQSEVESNNREDDVSSAALEVAVSDPVMRMLGDDSLWDAKPDELIERLLPMLDEMIDPSPQSDAELDVNSINQPPAATPFLDDGPFVDTDGILQEAADDMGLPGDGSDGSGQNFANAIDNRFETHEFPSELSDDLDRSIHQLLDEAGALLMEATLSEALDVSKVPLAGQASRAVEYDVVQPESNRSSSNEPERPTEADTGPHRPYSQLFSELRRRHPSSS